MPMTMSLCDKSRPFVCHLDEWYTSLPAGNLADIVGSAPEHVALISIDMINGFCHAGPLASARVGRLAVPVAALFQRAYDLGVRALLLAQDSHPPDTPEFAAYPPHCIAGTAESETIPELATLPFASELTLIEKNSLSLAIGTTFDAWMQAHPDVQTYILVGDCTDLCVYSAAMYLRMHANAHGLARRVIVPASAVDTYDVSLAVARDIGAPPHDGDLHHVLFLHHMAANGVEVVGSL